MVEKTLIPIENLACLTAVVAAHSRSKEQLRMRMTMMMIIIKFYGANLDMNVIINRLIT